MGFSILSLLGLLCLWVVYVGPCDCQEQPFVISSFTKPVVWLRPYDWTYLRVEIPSWFSSVVLTFVSNVEIDKDHIKRISKSELPLICFKDGSPPIPDISNSYLDSSLSIFFVNGSFGGIQIIRAEQCAPFQKNMTMILSNEQIHPGVWYFGFFNGLGPARTQSKMISRGHAYMFSTNIVVQGCPSSMIWGPYCNQSIDMVSCSESSINFKQVGSNSSMLTEAENLITCKNSIESACLGFGEFKFYFLDVLNIASQFEITVTDFRLNQTSLMNNSAVSDGILLMCYARYNAMPLSTLHDYSADISSIPLIVKSPKLGRWYIAVQAVNQTKANTTMPENYSQNNVCFSFEWKVHECVSGKVGLNCTWESHMLQRVPRSGSSTPSESYFLPIDKNVPMETDNGFTLDDDFPLDHLLSNSSSENDTWTYFFLDIPRGAAGANLHVQLVSETKLKYAIYAKYNGLASSDNWDYYVNSTNSSNASTILALNDTREVKINFYILYAQEGHWCLGLKHPPPVTHYKQLTMSVGLEGCPKHCSSHGQCHYSVDESGLTFFSYCACDRDHGGFDCSNELISHRGHIWQSIFLIASNAAAILPAFWTLRQKAFAEWVLFTSSGISSGLYHACDVGTWCVLSFRVLQFMDFWLSFMAVVSTFVYLAMITEASKRAIHTVVAIITALLAVTGATRSANIVLVIALGTLGLFVGWLLEFSTSYRFTYCLPGLELNLSNSWQNVKRWFWNLVITLNKRFHWPLVFLGFIALAFAATCWRLETNRTYWIWHSLWHVSIYTSSFFFLWSTSVKSSNEPQAAAYELTRQDSSSRTE